MQRVAAAQRAAVALVTITNLRGPSRAGPKMQLEKLTQSAAGNARSSKLIEDAACSACTSCKPQRPYQKIIKRAGGSKVQLMPPASGDHLVPHALAKAGSARSP